VGEQWIVAQEIRESGGGKNKDKKIVMVKLILKKHKNQKPGTITIKSSVCSAKFLDLFLWCPMYWCLVLGLWGRVVPLLLDSLWGGRR
jgi:hypothetical protein